MQTTLAAGVFSPDQIVVLFLAFAVLLGLARLLGELSRALKQPAILGEILAGVLLGPTVLGAAFPEFQAWLFPVYDKTQSVPGNHVAVALEALFAIGAALLLLIAGLEVELSTVWRQGKRALWVSVMSMVVPFAVGFGAAWFGPQLLATPGLSEGMRLPFALFIGVALSITALPVIAKILMDLNLSKSDFGTVVISSAMVNDLIGWMGFALILAMVSEDAGSSGVWTTVGLTLAFIGGMLTFGRWGFDRLLPWSQAHLSWPGGTLGLVMTVALMGAAFTEHIGIHSIFGAFIVGVAAGDSRHLRQQTRRTVHDFVGNVFAPLFFASIGLRVDFVGSFELVSVVVVLVIAVIGKLVGAYWGAKWSGMSRRESGAVGFAMCARGAMEIILGSLALEAGLIGDELFVAIVIMALVTSLMSGPAIERILQRDQPRHLRHWLTERKFIARMTARTRSEAIDQLCERAAEFVDFDKAALNRAVLAREAVVPTGLANGIAVPHARLPGLQEPLLVVGRDLEGIDFDAADGERARIICLTLTPEVQPEMQLEMLSAIAEAFADASVREAVLEADRYTEFLAALSLGHAHG